jgi:DNA-binding CsgD family transcriptional regulator
MPVTADILERGRASFGALAWADAYEALSAADRKTPLAPEDLERLAAAAYLAGHDDDSAVTWERAHRELLRRGDAHGAARCAFWLAIGLLFAGEAARGGGWVSRGQRLLDQAAEDCVERGYLIVPVAVRAMFEGDYEAARETFAAAVEIAERFGDADLIALARHGQGRALIRLGRIPDGTALLDEAMVAVTTGEVSALMAGEVYCSVIQACQEIFDLRRAQAWTAALSQWCALQPDLIPYRGQCLLHRAEIMQLHGAWEDAMDEVRRASERLGARPSQAAAGAAFYQQAELHRLCGEFAQAEEAYRQASRCGREPQPGLARLRMAQGQLEAARAAIRRAIDEAKQPASRARLLPAVIEVMLAADDLAAARTAVGELSGIADRLQAPLLRAVATQAEGAVLLAEGDAQGALAALREAWTAWQELEAPHEAARTRALIGLACRALGDEEGAEMELDAARWAFQELGATPDVASIEALSRRASKEAPCGLTAREVEVLRLVAAGKTNRAIATDLFLSEKTVARHVSNIFGKVGLSTRAAATAYAYENALV